MLKNDIILHPIQRSVIQTLRYQEHARFRDLRPQRVDTNLFSYHLKLLQKAEYIVKTDHGYRLGGRGLRYVDRVNADLVKLRIQPKIITMLLVQDGYGKVLLQRRTKQPYINTWTLPYGKLHIDDQSVLAAGRRESQEKLGFDPHKLRHVGDCYIVVRPSDSQAIESRTLAHIVRFETDAIAATDELMWAEPLDLAELKLAPAVEQIVTRSFFGDDFFFEEFQVPTLQT